MKIKENSGEIMDSKILQVSGNYLLPVLLIFSLFLLFQGHDEPGGGFVGGLTASSGFALFIITHGQKAIEKVLPFNTLSITAFGLTAMVVSGMIGLFSGGYFLEASKTGWELPLIGQPGTAFLFDLGVYFVVIGSVTKVVLTLINE